MPKTSFTTFKNILRSKIALGIVAALIVGVGGYFVFFKHGLTYQFVTVQKGSIAESVSLTGNTTPAQSVSLSFGGSGVISNISSALGKQVYAGQILAELNTNDLVAGLHQAQANVAAQQAKLDGLKSGSRPEDVAVSQAALDKAQQDLANIYAGIGDTSVDAYAKANDAVRTQLGQLFSNSETQSPALTYIVADFQAQSSALAGRSSAGGALTLWQGQLTNIDQSSAGLELLLQNEISYLTTIRQLLNSVGTTLDAAPSLSVTTIATYKADVSAALSEVNTAAKNLNTISQTIASQKLTISQSKAQLDLKLAGSSSTDIAAQQAQVAQAQASVASAAAKIQNAQIIAPISGIITQFDAKVGQLASPSMPLIAIMSNTGYEVDAGISETDIGKVQVGNIVSMTLDAFPNETFTGTVFYIAPSQTNTQGVISYQIKISFGKADPRLKSGLTANIDIQTKKKDNVLLLPQYAILQNDTGTFVETLTGKIVTTSPVTLGIQDQKGDVEILSGVTEGEQVINIGLKAQ
jgi:HlyD family secretion protein